MLTEPLKILLIEDNPGDARLIREMLGAAGQGLVAMEWVTSLADGLESLGRGEFDLVLLDLGLPDSRGLETFTRAYVGNSQLPFVVLTGLADETVGIAAVRQGAQDYLLKGEVDGKLLIRAICYAVERKRIRDDLRESEDKYRVLVSQVPAVVFKGYADWSLECFDNKVEALTGYAKEDFDSRRVKWCDLIPPEDLDYATRVFIDALKTDRAYVREHRIRRKDGEIRWVQCRGQISCDAAGKIDYISGVTFDVTEHKQLEETLRQARDELEQRVAARTADLAQAVEQLRQEVDRRKQAEHALQKAHDDLELKVAMRTAELARANLQMEQEVEERRRAEEAVEAERWRLFSVLDSIPAIVYVKSPDYSIRFANRIFRETFGDPDGKTCYEAVFNRQEPCPDCRAIEVLKTKTPQEWEWRRPEDNRIYQFFIYPFADIDGSPLLLTLGVDLTARKQAEEGLKASEARFRELFNSMSSGVAVYEAINTGRDFIFTDFNRAAEQIDKIKKEDLLGKSVQEVFPGVRDFGLFEVFQRVWRTGIPEHHPVSFYQDQRLQGWRENYVYRLPSEEIVAVYDDVTARKQAEETLRQSEARLAEAERISRLGSWEWDVEKDEAIWSNEMFRILNLPVQERGLNYEEFFEYVHPEDREKNKEAIAAALAGRRPYFLDVRILPQGGSVRIAATAAEVIFDETTKKPVKMAGTLQDVTERRIAEMLLRDSEERFRAIFEAAAMGIALADLEGRLLLTNKTFQDMLGYAKEELRGKTIYALTHKDDQQRNKELFKELIAGVRDSYQLEKRYLRKGGQIIWARVTVSAVRDAGGQPRYTMGMVEDITQAKEAAERLQESEKNLRYLTTQLLSAQEKERKRISRDLHDVLGQSLLSLKLEARAIEREMKQDPHSQRAQANFAVLHSSMDGLIDVVRRLSRDLSPHILEDLGITAALKHLFAEFGKRYAAGRCSLRIDPIDDYFSLEDQMNIYRIFQEGLTNIGKYAEATQIFGKVILREGKVCFLLKDNGRGFDVPRTVTADATGRGLGLAFMQERVRMLGSELQLWSNEGKGTRISFVVPVAKDSEKPVAAI